HRRGGAGVDGLRQVRPLHGPRHRRWRRRRVLGGRGGRGPGRKLDRLHGRATVRGVGGAPRGAGVAVVRPGEGQHLRRGNRGEPGALTARRGYRDRGAGHRRPTITVGGRCPAVVRKAPPTIRGGG